MYYQLPFGFFMLPCYVIPDVFFIGHSASCEFSCVSDSVFRLWFCLSRWTCLPDGFDPCLSLILSLPHGLFLNYLNFTLLWNVHLVPSLCVYSHYIVFCDLMTNVSNAWHDMKTNKYLPLVKYISGLKTKNTWLEWKPAATWPFHRSVQV